MSDTNGASPPPAGGGGGGAKWALVGLAGAVIGGLAVWFFARAPGPEPRESRAAITSPAVGPNETPAEANAQSMPLAIGALASPAIVAEVRAPAKLRTLVLSNAWTQEALRSPTGRGFLGSWAGFLGTRGEDVGGAFGGTVLEFLADQVLASPFQVVWFGGRAAPGSPALVVNDASAAARAAFAGFDKTSRRGTVEGACPATPESQGAPAKSVRIARWLLADHPVFAAIEGHRIVLSREPGAVLHAACSTFEKVPGEADVAVQLHSSGLGREVQELEALAGVKGSLRLEFGIENETLVPKGITGDLFDSDRLAKSPLPEELLRAVPAGMPVVLGLGLQLPEQLDAETLRAWLTGEKGKLVTRHVMVLWRPHGNRMSSETALVWSRAEDAKALEAATASGWDEVCGLPAYASTATLIEELRRTCGGQNPSLLNGPPQVTAGLRKPLSIALGVDFGRALATVTEEAYREETGAAKVPAEMEEARKLLESLPFFGLGGVVQSGRLVPGGFRS